MQKMQKMQLTSLMRPVRVRQSVRQATRIATPKPIYFDMQATTPTDPRVVDAMLPYFSEKFGNPHSRTHVYGWESEAAVERARAAVAGLIGADAKEIVFTSGATESNNLAVKGVARFYKAKKRHVITTVTEHKCVLDSCRVLQAEGFDVTYLPVQQNGLVDVKELEAAMREDTVLVSIMAVNNEIGVIQPLKEIGALCKSRKIFLYVSIIFTNYQLHQLHHRLTKPATLMQRKQLAKSSWT